VNGDFLAVAAQSRPDAAALRFRGAAMSYAVLDAVASGVAGAVAAAGFGPGDRVAVWGGNDPEMVAALWGIPRAGAMAMPLNTRLAVPEARRLVMDAGIGAVLAYPGVPDLGVPAVAADPNGSPLPTAAVDGPVYVVFTSGSSGPVAKGVVITRKNIAAAVAASRARLGNSSGDAWLAVLPLFHVGGLSILWRSAEAGGTVVLHEQFDPAAVAASLRAGAEATFVSLVPTMLDRVLATDSGPYHGVSAVLLGGGPIPPGLVARAEDAGLPVAVTYGMTETASQVATAPPGTDPAEGLDPLDGVEVEIVDGAGVSVGPGIEGTIRLRGPILSPGYLGEPARPPGAWFTTGDRGVRDAAGRLRVTGRSDDVIVTGGENVHPGEVEAALRLHPRVRDIAVFGVDDDQWGRTVAAAVVTDGAVTKQALAEFLSERIAGFKVPRVWRFVPEVPRTELGKIDRRRLGPEAGDRGGTG
jgi:O-succinylbenzoic acid--CoA ligase